MNIFNTTSRNTDLATLILRLLFGGMFFHYGYGKIVNYEAILPNFGDIIGIGSKLSLNLVIFAEFFCGILVAIGLFTRWSVIPVLITMVVAYFVAHQDDGFMDKQLPFIWLILCFVVFLLGSGRYSVDHLLRRSRKNN